MDSELDFLEKKLNFFKKIDSMIKNQASGYEIAYEIEKQMEEIKDFHPSKPFSGKKLLLNYKKYQNMGEIFRLVREYKREIIPLDCSIVAKVKTEIENLEEKLDYLKFKMEKKEF